MQDLPTQSQLYADSSHGIYIPQLFAESGNRDVLSGVNADDMATLESGPDTEWYWEASESILDNARLTDSNGQVWTLYQDGDLWLVPVEWCGQEQCWMESAQ